MRGALCHTAGTLERVQKQRHVDVLDLGRVWLPEVAICRTHAVRVYVRRAKSREGVAERRAQQATGGGSAEAGAGRGYDIKTHRGRSYREWAAGIHTELSMPTHAALWQSAQAMSMAGALLGGVGHVCLYLQHLVPAVTQAAAHSKLT